MNKPIVGADGTAIALPDPAIGLSDDSALDDAPKFGTVRWIIPLIAALALTVLLVSIIKLQGAQIERDAFVSLEITARLKAQLVESWLAERHGDGKVVAADAQLIERIADVQHRTDSSQQTMIQRLRSICQGYMGCSDAYLLDPSGKVLFAANGLHNLSAQTLSLLPRVFASGEIEQSDFYIDAYDGVPALNFVVPLQRTIAGKPQAVAALVLHTEPNISIFPLILTWPTSSPSGETLLVRGEGESVVFLNELRHIKNTALKLTRPLADPRLPAAVAIRSGKAGTVRGWDYRGTEVLAAYQPVAGTDWHIVAKLDYDEVMAPLWKLVASVGLVSLAAILFIGAMQRRFWVQQQRLSRLALRARLAQGLRESEERFRAYVDQAADALFVHDFSGKFIDCNLRACASLGYSREELLNMTVLDVETDFDLAQAQAEWSRVLPDEPYTLLGHQRRKDGTTFPVEIRVGLLVRNGQHLYMAMVRDVTEREQEEEHIRKLLQAVEQSPVSIIISDREGIIEYVNAAFTRISGYAPEEVIGRDPSILKAEETSRETYQELWRTILDGGTWHGIFRNRCKNGDLILEDTSISPIFSAAGDITHFVAVKEDVTERKRIEQELAEHQAHLEVLVAQRTGELSLALEAAQLADQTKDEFLANITHELRTPLSAVIGMAGLARGISCEPRQRNYLDKISLAGKHLNRIINDLLDLSKIAAGHLTFENRVFSLRGLILRGNSVMSHRAAEKGLELIETIDDAVPDVLRGDPLRIEQILLNLVANAIKFTAQGRIEVRISLCRLHEPRVCLDLAVEDTGIGIRPEDLDRLFKPFSQADASMSRKFGGTGLGLAICRRLAEMMDGDISVTSREGSGTTFRVRLWLDLAEAGELPAAEEQEQESAQVSYQDARVLVVDDQPFNRDVVQGLLAVVGITPQVAENGQVALDILRDSKETFDLILMDVQMPVMDGLTATRAIRSQERFAALPIVAMTAHTMTHEKEKSKAAGMNDHIGKPFDEAGFYRVLAKWIPASKQRLLEDAVPPAPTNGMPPLRGVDTGAGLALLQGDEARYRHWLCDFVAEAPIAMKQIREALAAGQPEPASMAAHTLKGRTGLLGMNELHSIAAALEAAIEAAEPTSELVLDLEHAVIAMCVELKNGLGLPKNPVAAAEPLPDNLPSGVRPVSVTRLIASLQAGDSDCDRLITDCLAELGDTPWAPYLRKALMHAHNFDFAAASRLLDDERQEPTQGG